MQLSDVRLIEFDELTIAVPSVDYPWIMEWDWEVDSRKQVTRLHRGSRVNLYHEILRRHPDDELLYSLGGAQVDALFRDAPVYQDMLRFWAHRVEFGAARGIVPPCAMQLLGTSLSSLLHLFDEWVTEGREYSFRPDPDGLTPGSIYQRRMRRYPSVRTLREFLAEYTGDWEEDDAAPAGAVPLKFEDLAVRAISQCINLLLLHENGPGADLQEIWAIYDDAGYPLGALGAAAHALVESYPTPGPTTLR